MKRQKNGKEVTKNNSIRAIAIIFISTGPAGLLAVLLTLFHTVKNEQVSELGFIVPAMIFPIISVSNMIPSIDGIEEYIISRSIPFDLMINLAEQPPKFFNCFDRLIEIVNASNKNKNFGRKRFSFYSKNGYEINTHKIN